MRRSADLEDSRLRGKGMIGRPRGSGDLFGANMVLADSREVNLIDDFPWVFKPGM